MAKKVFFSFHYQDIIDFRANVVRNHWVVSEKQSAAGYFDKSIWEESKKTSSLALKKLINSAVDGTSVTCVLIGTQTYSRPWVRYEIFRSIYQRNKILGVHINSIKGKDGLIKYLGPDPFYYTGVYFSKDGLKYAFIYRESINDSWKFWGEIESRTFHVNDYFDKQYAKVNSEECIALSNFFPTYDWVKDYGYQNFKSWII